MKIDNILFWVVIFTLLIIACGKEPQPNFLSGNFRAEIFEILDCNDASITVRVDLSKDSTYLFNCDTFIINCDTMIEPDTFYTDETLTTIDTIVFDTMIMGCEEDLRNCNLATYNEVLFSIDSLGSYSLIIDRDFDGVNERSVTNGTYVSDGFNDLKLCVNDCADSLWFPGVFALTNNKLNLSWLDTIDSGCGYYFVGDRF